MYKINWDENRNILNNIINTEMVMVSQVFRNSNKFLRPIQNKWLKLKNFDEFSKFVGKNFDELVENNMEFHSDDSYIWYIKITTICNTLQELDKLYKADSINPNKDDIPSYNKITIQYLNNIYIEFTADLNTMTIYEDLEVIISMIINQINYLKNNVKLSIEDQIERAYLINDVFNEAITTMTSGDEEEEIPDEISKVLNYIFYHSIKISTVLLLREMVISNIEKFYGKNITEYKPLLEFFESNQTEDLMISEDDDLFYQTLKN